MDRYGSYIRIPLRMIQLLHEDKGRITDAMYVGVWLSAKEIRWSHEDAAKQAYYVLTHETSPKERVCLPPYLRAKLQELDAEHLILDEDHGGFTTDGYNFMPGDCDGVIEQKCKEDERFEMELRTFYAVRQVAQFLNFKSCSVDKVLAVRKKYGDFDGEPFAWAKTDVLARFKEEYKGGQLDNDGIARFFMYLGIKSIIGSKDVARTNRDMIMARAVGAISPQAVEGIISNNNQARMFYEKYLKKWNYTRVCESLVQFRYINRIYSIPDNPRAGVFVSCEPDMSDVEFASRIKELLSLENRHGKHKQRARSEKDLLIDKIMRQQEFGGSGHDPKPTTDNKLEPTNLRREAEKIFTLKYKELFGEDYFWSKEDSAKMTTLLNGIRHSRKSKSLTTDDEGILEGLRKFLDYIHDDFILNHFTVPMLVRKYNEICAGRHAQRGELIGQVLRRERGNYNVENFWEDNR